MSTLNVASFDVFETLLLRGVAEPSAAFLLMAHRARDEGLIDVEPGVLAVSRAQAETRARRRQGHREVTLSEIHAELADGLRLGEEVSSRLRELELSVEDDLLVVHPEGLTLLTEARARRERIVFVSDTYLPEGFLIHVLQSRGLYRLGDGIFASCASGRRTKVGGRLFPYVLDVEGANFRNVLHVGNSDRADRRPADRAGIRTHIIESGNPTRREMRLEEGRFASGGLSSVMAGAARLARVRTATPASTHEAVVASVAAEVAAPLLCAFVLWTLREAERAGLRRLYFLAREGQILFEVASEIKAKLGSDIELRYLYVSRQSLNVAAISHFDEDELAWTLTHAASNTTRTILQRLGIQVESCARELEELGLAPAMWDTVPAADELQRLLDSIREGSLHAHAIRGVERAGELAARYLKQEGVFDEVPMGVVDTSGSGSQIRALARLRTRRGKRPAQGYLLVRRAPPHRTGDNQDIPLRGWYEDEVRGRGYGQPPGRAVLLEAFSAADHGTVLGYAERDGRIEPRLAVGCVHEQAAWGLGTLRATIVEFARALHLDSTAVYLDADLRGVLGDLLQDLWERPSLDEATVWGCFPFEGSSGQEVRPQTLARSLLAREVIVGLGRGGIRAGSWFEWPAASQRISRPLPRMLLRASRCAKWAIVKSRRKVSRSAFNLLRRHS